MADPWAFPELKQPMEAPPRNRAATQMSTAWQNWRASPTPQAMGSLLESASPVIATGIQRYGGAATGSPNLKSHAKRLAVRAFETYDPAQGDLHTHLMSRMQGLQRIAARSTQPMPMPEELSLGYHNLIRHESNFKDQFGRDPSDAELSELTGLSLPKINKIRKHTQPLAESQLSELGNQNSTATDSPASSKAWADYIYHDLGPTDQLVLDYSLGRNGTPKLQVNEIAKRLGITAGAVSQRTTKLQKLLDARHDLSFF